MLTLTENARDAIKQVLASEGGGLRIAATDATNGGEEIELEFQAAALPEPGDEVLEADGAQVFVESRAAEALEDYVVDAELVDRDVYFRVLEK